MFRNIGPTEIIVIVVILVLIFGAAKLPNIARNVGKSMKVMKEEIKDLREDDKQDSSTSGAQDAPTNDAPTSEKPPSQPSDQSSARPTDWPPRNS
ncbi:Sec-independent protein translocase subunit TatA [Serinibacter salmoneus]|uniref:Sec-independent protein translocase protein TatA n=1 Tax=Serinibacter salmoneus TaxID=556530 RepID=A0A2A9D3D4_9MICO|nr:Sec-independent protein translocase subunit TatA [Serinibacter salmoneus]PFG20765.1 sec-independent protein translocase protein TatA [Serinibacter salmoneus]